MTTLLHPLTAAPGELPERFTWPFDYTPHPLALRAAALLQARLEQMDGPLRREADAGKMFGVLVAQGPQGVGYLAAFSAQWGGSFMHAGFVPPLFDYVADATVQADMEALHHLTDAIAAYEQQLQPYRAAATVEQLRAKLAAEYARQEAAYAADRARRHARRQAGATPEQLQQMERESQFQKAELRRLRHRHRAALQAAAAPLESIEARLREARDARKDLSQSLQRLIFDHSVVRSALGDEQSLNQIFAPTPQRVPPSGAGECCAPKLLQYALSHGLRPLCMAEFWWGRSPRGLVRRQGAFYPACAGKCRPILTFMLRGLKVDADPQQAGTRQAPRVLYEDEHLAVVCKPAGLLSVPGRVLRPSVQSLMAERWHAPAYLPHRLDQDTSGLLLVARDVATLTALQAQFRARAVRKTYEALLAGTPAAGTPRRGIISLPLAADYMHRPAQRVDPIKGRAATTIYLILPTTGGATRVLLRPLTGRTHQLRLHCAHAEGLNCPIVGDALYGRRGECLCLHARRLSFIHPATGCRLSFDSPAPF